MHIIHFMTFPDTRMCRFDPRQAPQFSFGVAINIEIIINRSPNKKSHILRINSRKRHAVNDEKISTLIFTNAAVSLCL